MVMVYSSFFKVPNCCRNILVKFEIDRTILTCIKDPSVMYVRTDGPYFTFLFNLKRNLTKHIRGFLLQITQFKIGDYYTMKKHFFNGRQF